ncbi:hypothetical protein GR248_37120 [Rhizobium leguminosarum]|uniref:DUF5372 family protein n=1 Tax=Rhizobium leguminosarum TaxID=384 RepID=UPI0013CCADB7|nr:hypothetical protein [Rhizobium leguminosarum]
MFATAPNAATANADTQLVRVTHPFHPLYPRQLPCVGKRYNRHGERLLLQTEDATVWSVPPQWTDRRCHVVGNLTGGG